MKRKRPRKEIQEVIINKCEQLNKLDVGSEEFNNGAGGVLKLAQADKEARQIDPNVVIKTAAGLIGFFSGIGLSRSSIVDKSVKDMWGTFKNLIM